MDLKTARLTILIDPAKKLAFEQLCRTQDMTPSQVVRRLIRDFMEEQPQPLAAKAPPRKPVVARKAAPAKAAPRKPAPRKAAARSKAR